MGGVFGGAVMGSMRRWKCPCVFPSIENWMRESGVNQKELGQKIGYTHQAISKIMCGKMQPSFDFVKAFLRLSGMTFEEAFGREKE